MYEWIMTRDSVFKLARFALAACVLCLIYAGGVRMSSATIPVPEPKPASLNPFLAAAPVPSLKPETLNADLAVIPVPVSKPVAGSVEADATPVFSSTPAMPGDEPEELPVPDAKPLEVKVKAALIIPAHKPMPVGLDPISDSDVETYKKIFALQAAGKIDEANEEFANLKDYRLRGHVLFQRYMHPTAYRSHFDELRNWMEMYADLPRAEKIYKLALSRKPAGFREKVREPKQARGVGYLREPTVRRAKIYRSSRERTKAQEAEIQKLERQTYRDISRNSPTRAYKRLKSSGVRSYMDAVEIDTLKANIARGYLYAGKPDEAHALALEALKRSGDRVPLAGWIAGQVAWREGDYKHAAKYFSLTGESKYASGWVASAGAFWTARCYMRTGNVREVSRWLRESASHSHTFYGLVATRALGRDFDFNWDTPDFTEDAYKTLARNPAGLRAMALARAGQVHLAEAELMRLDPHGDAKLKNAMLAYAGYEGLPGLAFRLGNSLQTADGRFYDSALYPMGPWDTHEDYNIDSALMHAIMRQESRFDPLAESRSGAKGLMQLMPATASYVSGNRAYRDKDEQYKLLDPETNLEIGQRYLAELLRLPQVKGDLFSLLVAYNAGPGNLNKWKHGKAEVEDPLLFIESIPVAETRAYVERVIANYWIYRLREGQRVASLDAVAEGKWARYAGYEAEERERPTRLASNDPEYSSSRPERRTHNQ